jgi:hypothetical protein
LTGCTIDMQRIPPGTAFACRRSDMVRGQSNRVRQIVCAQVVLRKMLCHKFKLLMPRLYHSLQLRLSLAIHFGEDISSPEFGFYSCFTRHVHRAGYANSGDHSAAHQGADVGEQTQQDGVLSNLSLVVRVLTVTRYDGDRYDGLQSLR